MSETYEQEFKRIVKIRNKKQEVEDDLFTTLFVAFILLPVFLLIGRRL